MVVTNFENDYKEPGESFYSEILKKTDFEQGKLIDFLLVDLGLAFLFVCILIFIRIQTFYQRKKYIEKIINQDKGVD